MKPTALFAFALVSAVTAAADSTAGTPGMPAKP